MVCISVDISITQLYGARASLHACCLAVHQIFVGSQSDPAFWARVRAAVPKQDILLDDGGHRMEQQIITFEVSHPPLIMTTGSLVCNEAIRQVKACHAFTCLMLR
jgi:hypothetical protein